MNCARLVADDVAEERDQARMADARTEWALRMEPQHARQIIWDIQATRLPKITLSYGAIDRYGLAP